MSIADIQAQIADAEARQAELRAVLARKQAEAKVVVVNQIQAIIATSGFPADDILAELAPRSAPRARKPRGEPGGPVAYPVYRLLQDPAKTYVRGVMPAWLKEAMAAAGLDPAQKGDRERFKAEHMRREAA